MPNISVKINRRDDSFGYVGVTRNVLPSDLPLGGAFV